MHKGKEYSLNISFSNSDDQPNTHDLILYRPEDGVMTPTRHGGVIPIAHILAHAISNHLDNHPNSNVNFFDVHSKTGRDLYTTLIRRLKRLGEQLGLKHELVQYDPKETPTHIITKP
jgi:1-acyl-sn-glycerol-3-phosphate acyltransferase